MTFLIPYFRYFGLVNDRSLFMNEKVMVGACDFYHSDGWFNDRG